MSARIPQESRPCRGLEEEECFLKTLLTEANPSSLAMLAVKEQNERVSQEPRESPNCVSGEGPWGSRWTSGEVVGKAMLLPEWEHRGKNPTFLSPDQTQLQASRERMPGDTEPREGQPFRASGVVADTTLRKLSSLAPLLVLFVVTDQSHCREAPDPVPQGSQALASKACLPIICKTAFSPDRTFEYNVVFQSFSQHRNNLTNW